MLSLIILLFLFSVKPIAGIFFMLDFNKDMESISYKIKKSARVRNMRLRVSVSEGVVVTAPYFASDDMIESFIRSNAEWIKKKMESFLSLKDATLVKTGRQDYLKNKEFARRVIKRRIEYFNKFYKFKFNRIAIKNQKSLWGSCSGEGNLNFNYALIRLSQEMLDYVIVHEMCHLWHFDHSKEFWKLVGRTVPDYRRIRREMKKIIFV